MYSAITCDIGWSVVKGVRLGTGIVYIRQFWCNHYCLIIYQMLAKGLVKELLYDYTVRENPPVAVVCFFHLWVSKEFALSLSVCFKYKKYKPLLCIQNGIKLQSILTITIYICSMVQVTVILVNSVCRIYKLLQPT